MCDIEEIRENYRNFYDEKIIQLARNDSKGLRPEVLAILKNEIIQRKLDESLITWIEAESTPMTDFEVETLKYAIRNLSCPNCENSKGDLRGYEINTIVSIVIDCIHTSETLFLCKKCGNKKKISSMLMTLFLGLWSAKGIFLTPITLVRDFINLFYETKISNRIFDDFIEANIGRIRLRGKTDKALAVLVNKHNGKTTS